MPGFINNRRRKMGNIQSLWEDQKSYGKGFHDKLFQEGKECPKKKDDDIEEQDASNADIADELHDKEDEVKVEIEPEEKPESDEIEEAGNPRAGSAGYAVLDDFGKKHSEADDEETAQKHAAQFSKKNKDTGFYVVDLGTVKNNEDPIETSTVSSFVNGKVEFLAQEYEEEKEMDEISILGSGSRSSVGKSLDPREMMKRRKMRMKKGGSRVGRFAKMGLENTEDVVDKDEGIGGGESGEGGQSEEKGDEDDEDLDEAVAQLSGFDKVLKTLG